MSRSAAVKRLMKEFADLKKDPSPEFTASPLENDIFEWHFTVRGPNEGGFAGGRYHGRIMFPPDYPFKPPNISFLTPNGRFEVNKKICLSITGFHPEYWRPAWGVRSALVALISFFPTEGNGAIAALDYTKLEREKIAKSSRSWSCRDCGSTNSTALPDESEIAVTSLTGDPEITFGSLSKEAVHNSYMNTDLETALSSNLTSEPTANKDLDAIDMSTSHTAISSDPPTSSSIPASASTSSASIPAAAASSSSSAYSTTLSSTEIRSEEDPCSLRHRKFNTQTDEDGTKRGQIPLQRHPLIVVNRLVKNPSSMKRRQIELMILSLLVFMSFLFIRRIYKFFV